MPKKVLLLGGTGAIGVYLAPELLSRGFRVDITTRSARKSNNKNLRYLQGDALDTSFLEKVLRAGTYDAVVDFMLYSTDEFRARYELLLRSCRQYVFISSYRVFANDDVITEKSARLSDVSTDKRYLTTDEYALAKARQEDLLRADPSKNWTIVRPAITYSRKRFQLGTLEADTVVWRALKGLPVILPREMLGKTTTMTWAGDVARLLAKLVLNKKAYGEDFNAATSRHFTWAEVAEMYRRIIGLEVKPVRLSEYLTATGYESMYQVKYDRMFDRVLDNTKILRATGERQEDFVDLFDGLKRELEQFIKNPVFVNIDYAKQTRIDKLTHATGEISAEEEPVSRNALGMQVAGLRGKLRPRTRIRSVLRRVKHAVRPRTRMNEAMQTVRARRARQKIKSADGVIITLNGYFNYGNILQRFALQEFLRQHGYTFISYEQPLPIPNNPNDMRFRWTAEFVDRHIFRKPYDPNDSFPVYIVGSDQVWRNWGYADEANDLGYFFFNFVKNPNARRIAYAASFGKHNLKEARISPRFVEYAKPFVDKFDAISMRENSGVTFAQKLWKAKAEQVIDPTMLLTANDYDKLIQETSCELTLTNSIFTYILGVNGQTKKIIESISGATKKKVGELNLWQLEVLPPVEQWLKGFRDADIVVTDSFHGTVFAIIYNTPFVVIENGAGGVARITSLLEQFGLEDRLVLAKEANKFNPSNLKPVNWIKVNKKLADLRQASTNWLLGALKAKKLI